MTENSVTIGQHAGDDGQDDLHDKFFTFGEIKFFFGWMYICSAAFIITCTFCSSCTKNNRDMVLEKDETCTTKKKKTRDPQKSLITTKIISIIRKSKISWTYDRKTDVRDLKNN